MDEKLKELREEIDQLDSQLMKLLDDRFKISEEVGRIKKKTDSPIESDSREDIILKKAKDFSYAYHIKTVYHAIFEESKTIQRNLK